MLALGKITNYIFMSAFYLGSAYYSYDFFTTLVDS